MKLFGFSITKEHPKKHFAPHRNTRAYYDAAAVTDHNANVWRHARAVDINSVVGTDAEILRQRCQYESANNAQAKGIIETFAIDLIGKGPRLQVRVAIERSELTEKQQKQIDEFQRACERRFSDWSGDGDSVFDTDCDLSGTETLSEILKLGMARGLMDDGEGIFLFDRNATGRLNLGFTVIDPARIVTPMGMVDGDRGPAGGRVLQGIEQDDYGKPLNYFLLKDHPQSSLYISKGFGAYDIVPADRIRMVRRRDRAQQARGIPWLTPSLVVFADLREYILATLSAARTAAALSVLLESQSDQASGVEPAQEFEELEVPRDTAMTLPYGYTSKQLKAEHPSAQFEDFHRRMTSVGARPAMMPYNIAMLDSARHNYASGRLDHLGYWKNIETLQGWTGKTVLRWMVRNWLQEAIATPGYLPHVGLIMRLGGLEVIGVEWLWQRSKHVDPVKEAKAQTERLTNHLTTLADEWGEQGADWEAKIRQRAREKELLRELELEQEETDETEETKTGGTV